jgi:hypothetical protein
MSIAEPLATETCWPRASTSWWGGVPQLEPRHVDRANAIEALLMCYLGSSGPSDRTPRGQHQSRAGPRIVVGLSPADCGARPSASGRSRGQVSDHDKSHLEPSSHRITPPLAGPVVLPPFSPGAIRPFGGTPIRSTRTRDCDRRQGRRRAGARAVDRGLPAIHRERRADVSQLDAGRVERAAAGGCGRVIAST